MNHAIETVDGSDSPGVPARKEFRRWAKLALAGQPQARQLAIRIVGREESRELNQRYRDRDRPTNVLSFPADLSDHPAARLDVLPLGDLVICAPLVLEESRSQKLEASHHWAHLTVHGVLHLLGYDHDTEERAAVMEGLEAVLLDKLGIADPYRTEA